MGWLRLSRPQRRGAKPPATFLGSEGGPQEKGQGAEELAEVISSGWFWDFGTSEDNVNSGSTLKTILFWLSIVLLGVMLWKLVSANGSQAREEEPSYSLLMAQIAAGETK